MKKHELSNALSLYLPSTPYMYVYMLQQVENDGSEFLKWVNRVPNYRYIMKRKKLVITKKVLVLLLLAYGSAVIILTSVGLLFIRGLYPLAVGLFIIQPALVILFLAYINKLGVKLIAFKRRKDLAIASAKLLKHKATKIVVLGSYGKTTAKELLVTTLKEGKIVAATPGNMNVAISHARWIINNLNGQEEIIIFELGESHPGDISKLCKLLKPDIAIVTGYAPNHIDSYGSVDKLKVDLVSIENFVEPENLYVESSAAEVLPFKKDVIKFDTKGNSGWSISNIEVGLSGTSFDLAHNKEKVRLDSKLIGEHSVPMLALCFTLGLRLGLTKQQVETGISKTVPFDHRMQARQLSGAWLIDDTYNGNLEGIRAGLEFLKSVKATRKMYITPGLVEQGSETKAVHIEIGHLIANAKPDVVVFMQNSVCNIMNKSLLEHGYKGLVRIETNPLDFYNNLQYEIVGGDLVMMQNDWTDNYN